MQWGPLTLTPAAGGPASACRAAAGHGDARATQALSASFPGNRDAWTPSRPGNLVPRDGGNPPAAPARARPPAGQAPSALCVPPRGPSHRPPCRQTPASPRGGRRHGGPHPLLPLAPLKQGAAARGHRWSPGLGPAAAGGGGAGGASGPARRPRPRGGEPGGAAALPLRSAPLLMAGPGGGTGGRSPGHGPPSGRGAGAGTTGSARPAPSSAGPGPGSPAGPPTARAGAGPGAGPAGRSRGGATAGWGCGGGAGRQDLGRSEGRGRGR